MTVLDVLTKLTGGVPAVQAFLASAVNNESLPESLRNEAADALAELEAAASPENLANLAAVIPGELLNISHGKLEGRRHPSDVA